MDYRHQPEIIEREVFVEKVRPRKIFAEAQIMLDRFLTFVDKNNEVTFGCLVALLLTFGIIFGLCLEHFKPLPAKCSNSVRPYEPTTCSPGSLMIIHEQEKFIECRCPIN